MMSILAYPLSYFSIQEATMSMEVSCGNIFSTNFTHGILSLREVKPAL